MERVLDDLEAGGIGLRQAGWRFENGVWHASPPVQPNISARTNHGDPAGRHDNCRIHRLYDYRAGNVRTDSQVVAPIYRAGYEATLREISLPPPRRAKFPAAGGAGCQLQWRKAADRGQPDIDQLYRFGGIGMTVSLVVPCVKGCRKRVEAGAGHRSVGHRHGQFIGLTAVTHIGGAPQDATLGWNSRRGEHVARSE